MNTAIEMNGYQKQEQLKNEKANEFLKNNNTAKFLFKTFASHKRDHDSLNVRVYFNNLKQLNKSLSKEEYLDTIKWLKNNNFVTVYSPHKGDAVVWFDKGYSRKEIGEMLVSELGDPEALITKEKRSRGRPKGYSPKLKRFMTAEETKNRKSEMKVVEGGKITVSLTKAQLATLQEVLKAVS